MPDLPFLWPWLLALLLALPLPVILYRRSRRRGAPSGPALLHPEVALAARAAAGGRRWPRHLGAVLYLLAIAAALVAIARPTLAIPEANPGAGIVLAIDVSRSMEARDIHPNRFEAAREAVRAFVESVPTGTRIGLVTFAGYATQVVPLTDDHARLLHTVDLLRMDFGTAIGEGLVTSVATLPSLSERERLGVPEQLGTVILLSDGRSFGGIPPLIALEIAKEQRVTVHTIGVGSVTDGPIPGIPEAYWSQAGFDEETMRAIAAETGGRYVFVDSADQLRTVYRRLSRALVWRVRRDEATGLAALAAALLLALSLTANRLQRRVV
jgi:Ca-activated chloride channel family protein